MLLPNLPVSMTMPPPPPGSLPPHPDAAGDVRPGWLDAGPRRDSGEWFAGLSGGHVASGGRRRGKPAWRRRLDMVIGRSSPITASLAAHALVLIVLALVITARKRAEQITLDLSFASEEVVESDATGVQIAAVPDSEESEPEPPDPDKASETAEPVSAPLETPEPSDEGRGATPEVVVQRVPLGTLLEGRDEGRRAEFIQAFGGSDETEAAVARALAWLARQQIKPGRPQAGLWSLKGPYADGGTQENQLAATAMALLAFQGAGNTPAAGRYKDAVTKGWSALVRHQGPDGRFEFPDMPHQHALYAHAMATYALCELFGMTHDPVHAAPAAAALRYAIDAQGPNGGWRYAPGDLGDMSVTGWYVMALKSGEIAGLDVPAETFDRLEEFLDSVSLDGGARYGYQRYSKLKPAVGFTPAVSAEGLLARQFLGWNRDDPRMIAGVEGLLAEAPLDWDNAKNVYAWYYVTQVIHNVGGDSWVRLNEGLTSVLPDKQLAKGREHGSWDPSLDQWGPHGGRLFMTCFCTWMLEVYYRHLQLYETVAPVRINQVQHVAPVA